MAPVDQTIIQAKVTLQDIEPPIWRRLLLPPSLNLADLHHVLQAAFGWRDEHLHEFIIGGLIYGAPELASALAAAAAVVGAGTLLIVEHARRDPAPERSGRLGRARQLASGDSALSFYRVMHE
jgi:hypothetical protein